MRFSCSFKTCTKTFLSERGLKYHRNAKHRKSTIRATFQATVDKDGTYTTFYHPNLDARPCDKHGNFLPPSSAPPPRVPLDATNDNPFYPFEDRLAFAFADFHFTKLQSSEARINEGLDLWAAEAIRSGNDIPWRTAEELYATIDDIQQGSNPWKIATFEYQGVKPNNAPAWMTTKYELCTRDLGLLAQEQLSYVDFDGHFDYIPYRQFNESRHRVYSNLMSADWAAKQADIISESPENHGAMLVPIVAGSDKTTTSVGTGHQEYHPFYIGLGNIHNTARRSHGISILPCAILPIPKANKKERETVEYQRFCRQLYHACLRFIYSSIEHAMSVPEVVRCPDGHFRKAIYSVGPYIADYPEQTLLACTVQNWCPKCDAHRRNLDNHSAHLRTHEKTAGLFEVLSEGEIWDHYGLRSDVIPFTFDLPRANIHEVLTPDILHQLIKGTFKDHLVDWIQEYILLRNGRQLGLKIIADIDRRISAVPIYTGLRRFAEGRDFNQWTGDDSKALMKVYLAAIVDYVPSEMAECVSAFINCCYIVRRNAITTHDITLYRDELARFHRLRQVFIDEGVRNHVQLPRQHAMMHYPDGIELFGSPNGVCSSITESKHIKAIKEPWRRSSRNSALPQMLQTLTRLEKLSALQTVFKSRGLLTGSVSWYTEACLKGKQPPIKPFGGFHISDDEDDIEADRSDDIDGHAVLGPRKETEISLAYKQQYHYPSSLQQLANYLDEPDFPDALHIFMYSRNHPEMKAFDDVPNTYDGPIRVFHSASALYFAPSDLCGAGGMYSERIRASPHYMSHPRYDTVLVDVDGPAEAMKGLLAARVHLFFSYYDPYSDEDVRCALVRWFVPPEDEPARDTKTGMWKVTAEVDDDGRYPIQVIPLNSILRGIHLLPCFGNGFLPPAFSYTQALDAFNKFYVNQFIDYHAHELLF